MSAVAAPLLAHQWQNRGDDRCVECGQPGPRHRFMRTIADVEASGYTAICVPHLRGLPGCNNHGHMPGVRKPEPVRITPAADNALTLFDVTGGAP